VHVVRVGEVADRETREEVPELVALVLGRAEQPDRVYRQVEVAEGESEVEDPR
jgi:hypothetical protein